MPERPAPMKIPPSMTPKEIGMYMGGLREHFKLSFQDVSQQIHIRARYVQAIEQGDLTQMPGKAYARGYLHTYAEFLGLDADQTVNQWFDAHTAPIAAPEPPRLPHVRQQLISNWQGVGIAAVMAVAVALVFAQLNHADREEAAPVASVEPVPEVLLESVRNLVMPTPRNIDCLRGNLLLSCFFADDTTQNMKALARMDRELLGSQFKLPEPVSIATEPVEQQTSSQIPKADSEQTASTNEPVKTKAKPVSKKPLTDVKKKHKTSPTFSGEAHDASPPAAFEEDPNVQ